MSIDTTEAVCRTQVYANQFKVSLAGEVDLNTRKTFELQAETVDVRMGGKRTTCYITFRMDAPGELLAFLGNRKQRLHLVLFILPCKTPPFREGISLRSANLSNK